MLNIFSEAYMLLLKFCEPSVYSNIFPIKKIVFLNSQADFGDYLHKSCVRRVF